MSQIKITKEQFRQGVDDEEGSKFLCPLCKYIAWKPLMCIKCYAVYCTECINPSMKCINKCPDTKFEKSLPIERIFEGLRFECPNKCKEPILYKEYEKHISTPCFLRKEGKTKNLCIIF